MSRFSETENALIARLRALKAKRKVTISLLDISDPLRESGFTHDEILAVLRAIEQDKIIAFTTANRIRMLKDLP